MNNGSGGGKAAGGKNESPVNRGKVAAGDLFCVGWKEYEEM